MLRSPAGALRAPAGAPPVTAGRGLLAQELAQALRVQRDTKDVKPRDISRELSEPLAAEEMYQQLLRMRAEPLSISAYQVPEAPAKLAELDTKIADATHRASQAKGKARDAILADVEKLTVERRRLVKGYALGAVGKGAAAGTGQITYAAIQVESANGERLALEFATTTSTQHAEQKIIEVLQSKLTPEQLRGARILVVGDQFVCNEVCKPALQQFARQHGAESVTGVVFQRGKLVGEGLASPRTTLRTATKETGGPQKLTRVAETIYEDSTKKLGARQPIATGGSAVEGAAVEHSADSAFAREAEAAAKRQAEKAAVEHGAESAVKRGLTAGRIISGTASAVEDVGIGIVTNYIASTILHGGKAEQERIALDAANRVPHVPSKAEEEADELLGWFPPGFDIAAAAAARLVTDTEYRMIEGDRRRKVEQFFRDNPDATPQDFDAAEDLAEKVYTGEVWDQ